MDNPQSENAAPVYDKQEIKVDQIQMKSNYELTSNNDTYLLTLEVTSDEKIHFKARQTNNISFYFYEATFEYEHIAKILLLEKNYYDSIQKIFKFYDKAMKRNKVSLLYNNQKRIITLSLKKQMDFDEVECCLDLNEMIIKNEDMIKFLFNEIKEMKMNQNKINNNNNNNNINFNVNDNYNNELIKNLIKKNEELERKMDLIIEENIKLKNSINELQKSINELKQKNNNQQNENVNTIKEEEENFNKQNININFYGNPEKLEYYDCLSNAHSNSGWLREFVVYTGIIDNIEYLVYNNKNSYYLDIFKIKDKKLVYHLKGHKTKVSAMRYFVQNNSKEYILSCDENRIAICWDIQNFNQKFIIYTNYSGYIWDALMIFNIYQKYNYVILPSNSLNESTRIYDFKQNVSFVKNIYGTKDNKTNYLIPWFYKNNYYLIECCNKEININNILKDETYAVLKKDPEGLHCCGYIYDNNLLCVTDYNNNIIRVWDLVNKSLYKQIFFDGSYAYGIIPWNSTYSIVACAGCLVVIDLIKEREAYKIMYKKANFCDLKKIELTQLGECLICSDANGIIRLFNLRKI